MALYKMKMNLILLSSIRENGGRCCLPERNITGLLLSFNWFNIGAIVECFPFYKTTHIRKRSSSLPISTVQVEDRFTVTCY